MSFRIGFGYDLHCLTENRDLILGGVKIDYALGLLGHSDADCLSHAIADAILGAAGLPDIGHHFPDTDPQYKGMDSQEILKHAIIAIDKEGFSLVNVDATIIAQAPKLAPHIDAMKDTLAHSLGVKPSCIGIKATTNEKQDAIGQKQAIATHAVCLITQRSPQP